MPLGFLPPLKNASCSHLLPFLIGLRGLGSELLSPAKCKPAAQVLSSIKGTQHSPRALSLVPEGASDACIACTPHPPSLSGAGQCVVDSSQFDSEPALL